MSRIADDLRAAKNIEAQTNNAVEQAQAQLSQFSLADRVPDSELDGRLKIARKILQQLSSELSDELNSTDLSARLYRNFQNFWDEKLQVVLSNLSQYPEKSQQKVSLLNAEREKICNEMENKIESEALEEQLTMLQRCTRQLEAAQSVEAVDDALVSALSST